MKSDFYVHTTGRTLGRSMDMKRRNYVIYIGMAVMALALTLTAVLVVQKRNGESARLEKSDENKVADNDAVDEDPDERVKHTDPGSADLPQNTVAENASAPENKEDDSESKKQDTAAVSESEEATAASVTQYNFHGGSTLDWPVKGNVIINYDMEHMVYFSTMDEYRYSPAIAIESDKGTEVKAAAAGEVTKVEERKDTGLTVTMRIGPEYEITYGQLKDCNLSVGDNVKRGEIFAKVDKVTAYYENEGDHLYLQLIRDGEFENPLSYLAFSE